MLKHHEFIVNLRWFALNPKGLPFPSPDFFGDSNSTIFANPKISMKHLLRCPTSTKLKLQKSNYNIYNQLTANRWVHPNPYKPIGFTQIRHWNRFVTPRLCTLRLWTNLWIESWRASRDRGNSLIFRVVWFFLLQIHGFFPWFFSWSWNDSQKVN